MGSQQRVRGSMEFRTRQQFFREVPAEIPTGDLAEPRGSGELHHGGAGRGRSSWPCILGAVDVGLSRHRGGHSEMSGDRHHDATSSGSSSTPTRGSRTRWPQAIESRAKIFGLQRDDRPGASCRPRRCVEIRKSKQKIETEQKFFPGYLLVEMELTDETWHLVRSTPKVTGFVRLRQQARSRCPPRRGRRDPAPDGGGRREAEAEVDLPEGRQGAGDRRARS